jgi:hypothetical protein
MKEGGFVDALTKFIAGGGVEQFLLVAFIFYGLNYGFGIWRN